MAKILIIEDNEDIRENLEELLDLAGYDISTAPNGAVGIEKAFEETPQLIICDISMPIKNGYEVFAALKSFLKEKQIAFIFLTASAQESDLAKGKASGADAYMTKPFQIEVLLKTISDLLIQKS